MLTEAEILAYTTDIPADIQRLKSEPPVRSSDVVRQWLAEAIKRDIRNIGCIYRSIGDALYDEPVNRLAERVARTVERELPNND